MTNARGKVVEMTPEQVVEWRAQVWPILERLCKLQTEVSDHLNEYEEYANDCFCGTGGFWPRPNAFRSDMTALAFIEEAVREKIAASADPNETPSEDE